jgi:hypothetical protein
MQLQQLIPLAVPWKVSPSTPFLRLKVEEGGEPTRASFVAHFALDDDQAEVHDGRSVEIVLPPDDTVEEPGSKTGPYQLVVVTFKSGIWTRWSPAYGDADVIHEDLYDWSAVSFRYREGDDTVEWLRRFRNEWRTSGLCPIPGIYEVKQSLWLQGVASSYRHFLIEGHDAYVEVLAEDWSWKSQRVLRDW